MTFTRLCAFAGAAVVLSCAAARASDMDSRIVLAAQNSYVFKNYLKDDAVKIDSKDGVVTLTGSVSDPGHRSLAEDTAANLPGVARVDNQLQVKNGADSQASDAWLSTKVKAALMFHKNVSGLNTQVSVKDGTATLQGDVASESEKELAGEYAKDVEGIKDVHNELKVAAAPAKPGPPQAESKVDDASITAQVKGALLFHQATSAVSTKVETTNGVVTLSGKAKDPAEKDLAAKLASDIRGVKSVVNNMSID